VNTNIKSKIEAITFTQMSKCAFPTGIGVIIAVIQSIMKVLKILLQTIFQTAKSTSFFLIATIDVINSGNEVQIATTVNQITVSLIHKSLPISLVQSTIHFEPNHNQAIHHIISKIDFVCDIVFISSISFISCLSDFAMEKV
jgi:hypothetical protein